MHESIDRRRQCCYICNMKTQKIFFISELVPGPQAFGAALLSMVLLAFPALAAEPETPMSPSSPGKEMRQAEREFEKAGAEFSKGETQTGAQRTGQTSWSDVATHPARGSHKVDPPKGDDPRASALQGSPETGYAGTWTDPATGDIITSVIAPQPAQNQTQNYPIVIEPVVGGGDWGYNSDSWNNNNNWGYNNGWPQWPGYVGEPGYGTAPPPPPPPPGGFNPGFNPPPTPGFRPNVPPFGPNGVGPNITHPFPPPPHPGYRPLRPTPPHGFIPPKPGNNPGIWQPGMRPPVNNWNPGRPPANNWGPGTPPPPPPPPAFNPNPGFMPGNPPGWKPLPMRPGGQGWGPAPEPRPFMEGGF